MDKELSNFKRNRHGGIDAIYNHPEHGEIPYTCMPAEVAEIESDPDVVISDADQLPNAVAEMHNRSRRAQLLEMADHGVNTAEDNGVDSSAWRTFRQTLRDITEHPAWPHLAESDWPAMPTA